MWPTPWPHWTARNRRSLWQPARSSGDEFDVAHETNPMGTVIEADDVGTLFAACEAAHRAVDADRVSTVLKIDDRRKNTAAEKVESVERALGRDDGRA